MVCQLIMGRGSLPTVKSLSATAIPIATGPCDDDNWTSLHEAKTRIRKLAMTSSQAWRCGLVRVVMLAVKV